MKQKDRNLILFSVLNVALLCLAIPIANSIIKKNGGTVLSMTLTIGVVLIIIFIIDLVVLKVRRRIGRSV